MIPIDEIYKTKLIITEIYFKDITNELLLYLKKN